MIKADRVRISVVAQLTSLLAVVLFSATLISAESPDDRKRLSALPLPESSLDRSGLPSAMRDWDKYRNQKFNPLFDRGAWHGFLLPESAESYGFFPGPMLIAQEYPLYISSGLEKLQISNPDTGQVYKPAEGSSVNADLAGLHQLLIYDDFVVELSLGFTDSHTTLVITRISNKTGSPLKLDLSWHGEFLQNWDKDTSLAEQLGKNAMAFSPSDSGINLSFAPQQHIWDVLFDATASYEISRSIQANTKVALDKQSYKSEVSIYISDYLDIYTTHRYFLSEQDRNRTNHSHKDTPSSLTQGLQNNRKQWLARLHNTHPSSIAIKGLQTLLGNWRAPRGALQSDGVVPSTTARWFNGLWAWDSWKHAVGLRHADPELAKSVVRSMFDFQIAADDPLRPQDQGMVVDAVFYNSSPARGGQGGNWNERNSKPPLATWAVWGIYAATGDISFVQEMYGKLTRYHQWWFNNRDSNKNGIAEYGATVDPANQDETSIIDAVAWESGMDNAPRFGFVDEQKLKVYAQENQLSLHHVQEHFKVKVLEQLNDKGNQLGYTLDQESVDLNSFLAMEAKLLSQMARLLGNSRDAQKYLQRHEHMKNYINQCMYDPESGFYYDLKLSPHSQPPCHGKVLVDRGRGPEGWSPLFAGIADKERARNVMLNITHPQHFALFLPTPTAAQSNPGFDPDGYWQGRVWLDQWYFAIIGLKQYGYHQQAQRIQEQLIKNAAGLASQESIRENYHPLTGAQQGATNFSWSAAVLVDLFNRKPTP